MSDRLYAWLSIDLSYFRLFLLITGPISTWTWHKIYLGIGNSSTFHWRAKLLYNSLKIFLFQNPWTNFNQTWLHASFGVKDKILKCRINAFIQIEIMPKWRNYIEGIIFCFSRTPGLILCIKRIQSCSNQMPHTSPEVDYSKIVSIK